MKNRTLLPITFIFLLFTSCYWSKSIELNQISDCQDEYRNRRVRVEGYFGVNREKGLVACETTGNYKMCLLSFASKPKVKTQFDAVVRIGSEPNEMESPLPPDKRLQIVDQSNLDQLTERLSIRTADGKMINGLKKVSVTGVVSNCDIQVEKIVELPNP